MRKQKLLSVLLSLSLILTGSAFSQKFSDKKDNAVAYAKASDDATNSLDLGITINKASTNVLKTPSNANPLSPSVYCADPTAVEYNGRLYVYATNDHQQSEEDTVNDYDQIDSLVVFSTEDMVNWVYHGRIEVGDICPWCNTSWAPSVVSRVEEDGLTHFYLYFSNNGAGVGVITSTDPVTGWTDPLGKPLVSQNTEGLTNCPAPFDPGACIDDNGVGWLTFGGGSPCNSVHSNIPKIVKLGDDLLSFDSDFVSIDAPYFFEASELNYIDGVYYYTYCNDWQDRNGTWDYEGTSYPSRCSMGYLTSTDPLNADSWTYKGDYFYNSGQSSTGESGLRWGNNHTHFCEYKGTNYILHHTLLLEELARGTAGFRSLMVDYLPMDSETQTIPKTQASRTGVSQVEAVDAYKENPGALMFTSADIFYDKVNDPAAKSMADGAWTMVKGMDFEYGAESFIANVKGKGRIEVRLDDVDNKAVSYIEFDNSDFKKIKSTEFKAFDGRLHNVFLVFSGKDIELDSFSFTKGETTSRPEEDLSITDVTASLLTISGQVTNPDASIKGNVEFTKSSSFLVKTTEFDKKGEVINLGFINTVTDANYMVLVKNLILTTDDGEVTIPVNKELNPKSSTANGLPNGWGGDSIGSLVLGTEDLGLFAARAKTTWVNYRFALKINGEEVKFSSISYDIDVIVNGVPVPSVEPSPSVEPEVSASPGASASANPDVSAAPEESTSANPGESASTSPETSASANPAATPSVNPDTSATPIESTTPATKVSKPAKVNLKKVTSPKKKTLKVTWKKAKNAKGYQVMISTNRKFTKNKKVYTVKNISSKLIKKLKSKKVYFVKVRGFAKNGSKKVYGSYSKIKKTRVR
ncbi:MAG: family 43 glycosylhydrolase [Lachnospiraceae bacterium]|nr:family 43 glycosylhydrolase [Lachnospiraceae bacterium]